MKNFAVLFIAIIILLSGCSVSQSSGSASYTHITQEEAMKMIEKDDGHVIVDVRRQDEYDEGHIPGAVLIPNETITDTPPEKLPNLNQIILVYCRSGRRSKEASQKLAEIGYTNVYEFGGIIDWTGETVMNYTEITEAETPNPTLVIKTNGKVFYANLEDNPAAKAFIEKISPQELTLDLRDYGSFEKVGELPWELPRSDEQIITEPGDIILNQGNQLTIYYDKNTCSFTRLAKIGNTSKEELLSAFGKGDVSVKMSLEWSE